MGRTFEFVRYSDIRDTTWIEETLKDFGLDLTKSGRTYSGSPGPHRRIHSSKIDKMNEAKPKQQQGNNTKAMRNKVGAEQSMKRVRGWSARRERRTYEEVITNNKIEHAQDSMRDWRTSPQDANQKGEVKKMLER